MKKSVLFICLLFIATGCTSASDHPPQKSAYNALYYMDLGKDYMRQKNAPMAKAAFLKAAQMEPENIDAWGFAGTAAKYSGEYDEAITYFKKASDLDPSDYRPYGNIGEIFHRQKKYHDAVQAYEKVLEINPGELRALNHLVELSYTMKDYKQCKIYMSRFDEAVSKKNSDLLPEKVKQYIYKAKLKHSRFTSAMAN